MHHASEWLAIMGESIMRDIIGRLVYDTDTAGKVLDFTNSEVSASDFKAETSALYRTASGRYFLCGRGGPMSRWRVRLGGGFQGATIDAILPLGADEALDIVVEYGDIETAEALFEQLVEEA
jgi:hypothetical protein